METNLSLKLRTELGVNPLEGDELKKATEAGIRAEAARLIRTVGREELTKAARDVNRGLEESLQTKEGRRQPHASLVLSSGNVRPYGNAAPEDIAAALGALMGNGYETFLIRGTIGEGEGRFGFARLLVERKVPDLAPELGFIALSRAACQENTEKGVSYERR